MKTNSKLEKISPENNIISITKMVEHIIVFKVKNNKCHKREMKTNDYLIPLLLGKIIFSIDLIRPVRA